MRVAAAGIAANMLVAVALVHGKIGFFITKEAGPRAIPVPAEAPSRRAAGAR